MWHSELLPPGRVVDPGAPAQPGNAPALDAKPRLYLLQVFLYSKTCTMREYTLEVSVLTHPLTQHPKPAFGGFFEPLDV